MLIILQLSVCKKEFFGVLVYNATKQQFINDVRVNALTDAIEN